MNRRIAEWLTRPWVARVIVALAAIVGLGAAGISRFVDHDDDVLAFLPEGDADVAAFRALNETFGGLEVAIVGIEADNPLDPELFRKLRELTQVLNDADEVKFALSLANVDDFRPSPEGGIETDLLVREVPESLEGQRALRQRVMSRDLVVGQLIAPGAKAIILYAFAAFGSDQRAFAGRVRDEVLARFPGRSVYLGGAPFVATYIYDSTQADLRKLTPWAVIAIVLLVFAAFRDVRGVLLALLATTFGIVVALALMVLTGHRYNIVLSSMPVILFSVGSAYGIHVLARYFALASTLAPREALIRAMVEVGPTVLAAGGTTVAGLLSFLTMDIQPLRSFGLFTAAGIAAALLSSLTFVPAMVVVLGIKGGRSSGSSWGVLDRLTRWLNERRAFAVVTLLVICGTSALFIARVDTRMDQSAFFAEDAPPARADRFLRRHFGGATFIQVHGEGDFSSPAVLRAWGALADEFERLPHVSAVQHAGQVVAQLNAALTGQRRIPDDGPQVKLLYRFLAGMPALEQLVTSDRQQAVMHVKVNAADLDAIDETLAAVEMITSAQLPLLTKETTVSQPEGRAWVASYLLGRIETLSRRADVPIDDVTKNRLKRLLDGRAPDPDPARVQRNLLRYLMSPESFVALDAERADRVSAALVADNGEREAALRAAVGDDAEAVEDLLYVAQTEGPNAVRAATTEAWVDALLAAGWKLPGGDAGQRLRTRVRDELGVAVSSKAEVLIPGVGPSRSPSVGIVRPLGVGVSRPQDAVASRPQDAAASRAPVVGANGASEGGAGPSPAAEGATIRANVSGLPVLHRGMSRSAERNQLASLAVALAAVILVLCALFRSIRFGLAAAVPTVCTLAVVYGAMGALGVHLDIGTSMIASLIIGAGVDYAVHLVAAHRAAFRSGNPDPLGTAVAATGTAIWTNALMVAAGFYLLTLGEARTLQNVGGLTAAAMIVAAVTTFGAVPALLPRPVKTSPPNVG